MPMLSQHAAAERIGNGEVAPLAAEVIHAGVVDAAGIDEAAIRARNAPQRISFVLEIGSQCRPAIAEVISREGPGGIGRWVLDPQQLIQIEVEIDLLTKDA